VARHIFQACPVWIYTQSNITNISYTGSYEITDQSKRGKRWWKRRKH
jgi:hypothetical protein